MLQKVFKVVLFHINHFLFKISHFIKIRNNTTTFISKFGISLGFNQLFDNLSFYVWEKSTTTKLGSHFYCIHLKCRHRNRYYGKGAYLVPKGSQRVHSQSLDCKVSFTREGMRTDCLHFAGEREQIVPKIEAMAVL